MIGTRHIGPGHPGESRDGSVWDCPQCYQQLPPAHFLTEAVKDLTAVLRELLAELKAR